MWLFRNRNTQAAVNALHDALAAAAHLQAYPESGEANLQKHARECLRLMLGRKPDVEELSKSLSYLTFRETKAVRVIRPSVTVSSHKGGDSTRLQVAIYNADFSYYDERGSKLVAPCTTVVLELTGIDPWISIGLFTLKEEEN